MDRRTSTCALRPGSLMRNGVHHSVDKWLPKALPLKRAQHVPLPIRHPNSHSLE